jgi:hypothetical protein
MEQVALILLFLTLVSAVIKTGFLSKIRHVMLLAAGCGGLVFAFYPPAIEQDRMLLSSVLSRRDVLLNLALLLIAENLLYLWGNIFRLRQRYGENTASPRWLHRLAAGTVCFPGIFFFGSLFFFEVQMFLMGWRIGFPALAAMLAAGTALVVFAGACLVRKLLPEYELRMETGYFLSVAQILLAAVIAAGASPAGDYFHHSLPVDWISTAGMTATAAAGCAVGYLWRKNVARRRSYTLPLSGSDDR